jgi:hypothetical protein
MKIRESARARGGGALPGPRDDVEQGGEILVAGPAFDPEVEFRSLAQLRLGGGDAARDLVLVILGALAHPGLQPGMVDDDKDGRHHAPQPGVPARDPAQAVHALHIDAHDQTLPAVERVEDARAQRAIEPVVVIAVDLGPFEKLSGVDLRCGRPRG